ncbi:hypothetical protein QYE76_003245 [Lolium multiflorum]|uniref:CCHC-type domain-containing protein n=1 Tax=Lolium multiflorum TaxID=4521 RepID=A0AAD8RQ25_LOLMU|nr:hypothetical protein QYE76_003245 [Lolium multiflorum]
MENYSLLMGASGDEDGGGDGSGGDGEALGHFRSGVPGRDSCPPDLGFAMTAARNFSRIVAFPSGGMEHKKLSIRRRRIKARRATGVITDQAAAHWANRGQRPPAPPGAGSAPPPAAKPAPPPTPTTGGGRAGDTRVCQLCGRPGHLASKCHRRFLRSFLGIGNNGQGNERQAQLADFGPPPAAPAAFAAAKGKVTIQGSTLSKPIDPAWYMDTGATDHLTSELQKLTTHQPYYGHDKVHTANGAGMPISHIGQASLLTSHPSRQLHLHNILRVPSVTRNLLSVPKLTLDNNVLCEFHPFDLLIKDRATRDVLLSGRLSQGLYRLEDPTLSRVFSGIRVSSSQWHSRLGHPATPIVRHVLHRHELPLESSNKELSVYWSRWSLSLELPRRASPSTGGHACACPGSWREPPGDAAPHATRSASRGAVPQLGRAVPAFVAGCVAWAALVGLDVASGVTPSASLRWAAPPPHCAWPPSLHHRCLHHLSSPPPYCDTSRQNIQGRHIVKLNSGTKSTFGTCRDGELPRVSFTAVSAIFTAIAASMMRRE